MAALKKKKCGNLFPDSSSDEDESNFVGDKSFPKSGGSGDGDEDRPLSGNRVQGDSSGFQINKNYAERYDSWRNKEELMKMKARYGTDNIDDIDSNSSSSSEEEEEWTDDKEKAFFKTLSNLKKKDPKIYDPTVNFFTPEVTPSLSASKNKDKVKKKTDKPFLLKDHERTMILEKGALISDSDDDDQEEDKSKQKSTLSYYQELDSIKKGFNAALNSIESDDDNDDDNVLLKKGKPKTEQESKQEDEDYRLWLKGELKRLDGGKLSKDEVKELSFLRSYWTDEKLDEGEQFLRDYILNRKYVEGKDSNTKNDDDDETRNYNQIAHDSDEGGLSNDEQFEEQREEFEHKYNFRFEEPDPEFIKRFPRTIDDSLRREDERRKKQRDTAKDRKTEAKDRKREQVQRLKAYKRKEILDKLAQLQEISGNPDLDIDLDGDFDPAEYDEKMRIAFNEEYYTEGDDDAKKPEFPYDPEIDDEANFEEWVPTREDDDDNDDNDDEVPGPSPVKKPKNKLAHDDEDDKVVTKPTTSTKSARQQELIDSSRGRKSASEKKSTSLFLNALEKKKPKFNPAQHKSFDQYFKEYYALDFEDLIGDLPCRFKYRNVRPNDFGLSTDEILKAEDRELNQWASLKKTYQYRPDTEETYEAQAYKKKGENDALKKRVLLSVYQPIIGPDEEEDEQEIGNNDDGENNADTTKKSKSKKKKKNNKSKPKAEVSQTETEIPIKIEADSSQLIPDSLVEAKSSKKTKSKKLSVPPPTKLENDDEHNDESSLSPTKEEEQQSADPPKLSKRQRKNRNKQNNGQKQPSTVDSSTSPKKVTPPNGHAPTNKKKHANSKKGPNSESHQQSSKSLKRKADQGLEDERLKAYGINPKKHKKWVKYGTSGGK